jgi:hypothetical protein
VKPPLALYARAVAAEVVVLVQRPKRRSLGWAGHNFSSVAEVGHLADATVGAAEQERHVALLAKLLPGGDLV